MSAEVPQQPLSCNYEWKLCYSQKSPCDIFGATCYSDGIAVIAALGEWIIIQMLKITINDNNEPMIFNTCNKQIRSQKPVIKLKKLFKIPILLLNSNFMYI